jgi:hypothetical protein
MFEAIEKLKRDLTDKYVVVDASIPELRRFEGHVGRVKTVNMSGRALVEFEAWNNIGWYDIEIDFLKVVPKPDATGEEKKHDAKREAAAKPAAKAAPAGGGEKKLSPIEMARMQGAAKPAAATEKSAPAAGAKKSTADILAAARAKSAPAATGAAAAPATKPKLSTADILAAARAKAAAEATPAATPPAQQPAEAVAETKPAAAAATVKPKASSQPALTPGQRPSVPEILAWCRAHDAK